ncbi:MAG: hypothetical protein ACP5NC_06625 [Nitrososphaeria archaeon]
MEKKSIVRNCASIIYLSFVLLLINMILFRYFFPIKQSAVSSPFGGNFVEP